MLPTLILHVSVYYVIITFTIIFSERVNLWLTKIKSTSVLMVIMIFTTIG